MTEADRTKLTILLHQFTAAERLSAMEIHAMLQFVEGRGFSIERAEHFDITKLPTPTKEGNLK
jgi:hypothetical protein